MPIAFGPENLCHLPQVIRQEVDQALEIVNMGENSRRSPHLQFLVPQGADQSRNTRLPVQRAQGLHRVDPLLRGWLVQQRFQTFAVAGL